MVPEIGDAGLHRGMQISRVMRQWHQQQHNDGKRHGEPPGAVDEKAARPLLRQARPGEQARQHKKERHQEDVEPGAEQVEAEPPLVVDDRKAAPQKRRAVERERMGRQGGEIGQHRMKGNDEQDDNCAQIVDRQARRCSVSAQRVTHGEPALFRAAPRPRRVKSDRGPACRARGARPSRPARGLSPRAPPPA